MKYLLQIVLIVSAINCMAQNTNNADTSLLKYNSIPAEKVTTLDNKVTKFNRLFIKNKPTVVIFFNPDCDHCIQEMQDIISNNEVVKEIQFVCISNRPISLLKPLVKELKLNKVKNVKLVSIADNQLFRYYGIGTFPSMVLYNKYKIATKKYISSMVPIATIVKWTSAE